MARRIYSLRPKCAADGCPERAFYEHGTRREYDRHAMELQKRPWHARGDEDPSPFSVVARKHLPGFKAYASDFPEGTRLIVTARILPPTSPEATA